MSKQPERWSDSLAAALADEGDYLGDLAAKNDRLFAECRALGRDAIKRAAIANWQIDRPGATLTATHLAALDEHIASLYPEPVTDDTGNVCEYCGGSGLVAAHWDRITCPECHGDGAHHTPADEPAVTTVLALHERVCAECRRVFDWGTWGETLCPQCYDLYAGDAEYDPTDDEPAIDAAMLEAWEESRARDYDVTDEVE